MAKRENGKGPPLCGDRLVDLIFKLIVDAINYRIMSIKKKKNLTDFSLKSSSNKKALFGLYDPNTKTIYLSASKCKHPTNMSMIPALIHEVSHVVMPDMFERRIYQLENILKTRFSDKQKRYLKRFIPKHEVKKGPKPN